jgi:shikimate kinase
MPVPLCYALFVNILLMGLRGSGKTTIGPALAQRTGRSFLDLDTLTLRLCGSYATVSEAWQRCGEMQFRQAEAKALGQVLQGAGQIVALGGGTPTAPGAAALIHQAKARGDKVIYLRATAQTLRKRLEHKTHDRPSLTGADPVAEVDVVLKQRDPVYLGLADVVIKVDGLTEAEVLAELLAAV